MVIKDNLNNRSETKTIHVFNSSTVYRIPKYNIVSIPNAVFETS